MNMTSAQVNLRKYDLPTNIGFIAISQFMAILVARFDRIH
jgi:hypothetical protein